jgi:uncharacterized protein
MTRGRILKAYETQFAWLLQLAGARRKQEGIRRMVRQAQRRATRNGASLAEALTSTYERLSIHPFFQSRHVPPHVDCFFCDSGLGGLARWLRAAGYKTKWSPGIDDTLLLNTTKHHGGVLLTTDSMLMERRLLRDRIIPSFWLPPTLSIRRQLELVFREFRLRLRSPLCMNCGGTLRHADKQSMRERIPPRTYKWLNDFFICENCGQLFWHGTHWLRITRELKDVSCACPG